VISILRFDLTSSRVVAPVRRSSKSTDPEHGATEPSE
jgi:hypothetical protein